LQRFVACIPSATIVLDAPAFAVVWNIATPRNNRGADRHTEAGEAPSIELDFTQTLAGRLQIF
jgi:hypothetical protein